MSNQIENQIGAKTEPEWVKELNNAVIARTGGVFNGDNPVYFAEEQKLWEHIKPQIKSFFQSKLDELIDSIPKTIEWDRHGNDYSYFTLPDRVHKELKQSLRKKWGSEGRHGKN